LDTLTHALSGALLARATAPREAPPRSLPRRIAAGFFSCAAPDLDFVIGFIGPVEYLLHHRGATHSLLLAPLWAIPVAWLLAKILREGQGKPGGWKALYGVCLMSILLHIAGDWITSYGTMFLEPFSDRRFGLGTTFIIDLWLSGLILLGLVASSVWWRSRLPAVLASAAVVALIAWQWTLKDEALELGKRFAQQRGANDARVVAYPRPVSPYNWSVFVSDAQNHHYSHINLRRDAPKSFMPGDGFVAMLDAPYRPLAQARWETAARYGPDPAAREAYDSPALAFFRWFADAPALKESGEGCYWFQDLRFLTPGRDWLPFQFGACREGPAGPWRAFERTDDAGRRAVD
jgi:inner membrane protein